MIFFISLYISQSNMYCRFWKIVNVESHGGIMAML